MSLTGFVQVSTNVNQKNSVLESESECDFNFIGEKEEIPIKKAVNFDADFIFNRLFCFGEYETNNEYFHI